MEPIKTSFGMIRYWQDSDAKTLAKYANNRKIWANMRDGFHSPYHEEHARAFLDVVSRQNPVTFFAIATADEAIGGIGLTLGQDVHRQTAELGYWLGEPFWGKRIMSEAVMCFTDFAFKTFDLIRIFAEPYVTNQSSCRILEKAGFVLEGRLKSSVIKEGQILDQLMYAKVKLGIGS